ncbi:MAG TPA: hypothetical protein VFZ48_02585 [Candidatus Saccharimonadales bacterium]
MRIETRRDRQQQRRAAVQTNSPSKARRGKSLDKKFVTWAFYAVALAVLAVAGTLFQEVAYGQIVILLYGCVATILRRDSSEMFKMALIALVCIVALTLIGNSDMAKAFAVYAFLFLAFGVVGECINFIWVKRKEGL